MTTDSTADKLRAISITIRAQQRATRTLEQWRNGLISEALAKGWTHARIAEATGLTRGRVGQLAAKL